MMVRGLFAIALAGCASQVIVMSRGSSGAVERDSDFQPSTGTDHHYISFPQYPLVNCTDPLIYDWLVERTYDALARSYRPAPARDPRTERASAGIDLYGLVQATRIGQLAKDSQSPELADYLVRLARLGAARVGHATVPPSLVSVVERSSLATLVATSWTSEQTAAIDRALADDIGDLIDGILAKAHTGAFTAADLMKPFSEDPQLGQALADIEHLAESYGATPCSSSLRYRNFFGYADRDVRDVSWIDRDRQQQLDALQRLARELGLIPGDWPRAELSFLHFSDVQIREPGAKLGGTQLSSTLRNIEPSFEQDYVQELYALYGYDAIVKTAWHEIELADALRGRLEYAVEAAQRPGPTFMIHTGDSADTGMQSEFDSFVTYTNKLEVPWYQVIGNHDVLAFGDLRMSSVPASLEHLSGRQADERCQGWGRIPCTCTDLNAILRNQEIREPDNRGATTDHLPSQVFPLVPIVLQRICLLHAVAADWFVMDPDKSPPDERHLNDPVDSFILSHCEGWHPDPSNPAGQDAALEACMAAAGDLRERYQHYVHRPQADQDCATLDGTGPPSTMHGFDTLAGFDPIKADPTQADPTRADPIKAKLGGYYCFEMAKPPGVTTATRYWGIVLNTNTDAGAYGEVSQRQFDWLQRVLPSGPCPATSEGRDPTRVGKIGCDDAVMVFSHQPIFAIYDQGQRMRLTDIVTRSPNVIAYIAGHTHNAGLRTIRPLRGSRDAHAKWEIVAPSVIDFPQAARQITIKTSGDLGYFEILTFTPHGTGSAVEKISAASRGAVRDRCRSAGKCDAEGHALLPAREVTFPRAFFRTPAATRRANADAARPRMASAQLTSGS